MEILGITQGKIQDMLLVFIRISSFTITAPIFGYKFIPNTFKIALALFTTVLVGFSLPAYNFTISNNIEFSVIIAIQVFVGITMGNVANFTLEAIRYAGSLVDLQMGFGMSGVIDPKSEMKQTLIGEFQYIIAILILLSCNGHHWLLLSLINTFKTVPLYQNGISMEIIPIFIDYFCQIFVSGLQLSIPILTILIAIDVVSGLVSKLIPQLNIFIITFPFKISAGFIGVIILLPKMLEIYREMFYSIIINLRTLF